MLIVLFLLCFCFLQFEEMYNILSMVKECTVYCQTTSEATAEGGLQRIVLLLTESLEPTKPLRVRHVPVIGQEDPAAPGYTDRPHNLLTETGRKTREAFNAALASRFLPRYKARLHTYTHPFDQAMVLSASMRQLRHIDLLLSSTAGKAAGLPSAFDVKKRIYAEVRDLIAKVVVEIRARTKAGSGAGAARVGAENPTGQR